LETGRWKVWNWIIKVKTFNNTINVLHELFTLHQHFQMVVHHFVVHAVIIGTGSGTLGAMVDSLPTGWAANPFG
jgi:hypothetical protein